jgi:hypothetical protein
VTSAGPPGLGKTLAVQIVCNNMKGIASPREPFRSLKSLQKFPYQCSSSSTAREIEEVYLAATARRAQLMKSGITTEQCVVILDEATLPKQQFAALKGGLRNAASELLDVFALKVVPLEVLLTSSGPCARVLPRSDPLLPGEPCCGYCHAQQQHS